MNAGDILVLASLPGQFCFLPSSTEGAKLTVDCSPNPQAWEIQWIGYSKDGTFPCSKEWDFCEKPPVSIDDKSWGGIKSLYR